MRALLSSHQYEDKETGFSEERATPEMLETKKYFYYHLSVLGDRTAFVEKSASVLSRSSARKTVANQINFGAARMNNAFDRNAFRLFFGGCAF